MNYYGIHFIGLDPQRPVIPKEWTLEGPTRWLFSGLFLTLCASHLERRDRDHRKTWIHFVWFILTSCSMPMVKQAMLAKRILRHQFSALSITPFEFLIEHTLEGRPLGSKLPKSFAYSELVIGRAGTFLVYQQLKDAVCFRHSRASRK